MLYVRVNRDVKSGQSAMENNGSEGPTAVAGDNSDFEIVVTM